MISGSEVVCRKSRYLSRFYVIHFKSQFILWSPIQRKCYLFYLCLHFLLELDLFNFTDYNQLKTYLLDKYNIPVFQYHTQGSSSSQIFGGAKKIAEKGSIFFPIWAKNHFDLGKKKYLVGQQETRQLLEILSKNFYFSNSFFKCKLDIFNEKLVHSKHEYVIIIHIWH